MAEVDLLVRGGTLVTHEDVRRGDIAVLDGKILALGPGLPHSAGQTIEAVGMHVFPGLIDSHVHFNEPGRAHWEGFESGSRALAAGGGTLFFDMPLNSHPPTIDRESFDRKLAAARATALVDFALWGGLVPGNLDKLEELADRGVVGFKAFMANSGIDDFPCVEDPTLRNGMKEAARLDQMVAVHAESEAITRELTERALAAGRVSVRDYLDSRPIRAEFEAIQRALDLAGETGCRLHIVHVSSGAGIALITAARAKGVNVSCETCPHYLALTENDLLQLGAPAKCAPPLRPKSDQETLWHCLQNGEILTIGSDHSPSLPEMKTDQNFFKVWGGISGVQHTLPLLLTEGHVKRKVALTILAKVLSFDVASRFRLPEEKGRIAIGADADLTLVCLDDSFEVQQQELLHRHRQSPYIARRLTGRVAQTILRGQTVCKDRAIVSKPIGRLVKPHFGK